jgi:hypothetical protein
MKRAYREYFLAERVLRQEPEDDEDEEEDNDGERDDDGDEGYSE